MIPSSALWTGIRRLAAAMAFTLATATAAAQEPPPVKFDLPLACVPGEDCWVANYVDVDAGPGEADFNCGPRTYDGHKGTDFAIRDMAALAQGVPVLAAAPGKVVGYRDGMDDIDFKKAAPESIKDRDCGNRIGIQHGNGWLTQYCHMRKGSVAVRDGDIVRAGQVIGMVGLSGRTEFPHLHFMVVNGRTVIDPYVGVGAKPACGMGAEPLWSAEALTRLAYEPAALYNAGFFAGRIDARAVRKGFEPQIELSRTIPELCLWVDMLGIRAGDELNFKLTDPGGKIFVNRTATMEKTQARVFRRLTVRRKAPAWPEGVYLGVIELTRAGAGDAVKLRVERTVTLR